MRGYGIIQPRVGTSRAARAARASRGSSPGRRASIRTRRAVSDVYQDLFGEGSYVGKAHLRRRRVRARRSTGACRRTGCSATISSRASSRARRWPPTSSCSTSSPRPTRSSPRGSTAGSAATGSSSPGSCPACRAGRPAPNDLRLLDRWKLFDNLRRSLVPPALRRWRCCRLVASRRWPARGAAGVFVGVLVLRRRRRARRAARRAGAAARRRRSARLRRRARAQPAAGGRSSAIFLLDQALLSLDAIARTLYRLFVCASSLLEWSRRARRARPAARGAAFAPRCSLGIALARWPLAVVRAATRRAVLVGALPLLVLWVRRRRSSRCWLSEPLDARDRSATLFGRRPARMLRLARAQDLALLRDLRDGARTTGCLPTTTRRIRAASSRTAPRRPTSGFTCCRCVAARDFGVLTVARGHGGGSSNTLDTLDRSSTATGTSSTGTRPTTLAPARAASTSPRSTAATSPRTCGRSRARAATSSA